MISKLTKRQLQASKTKEIIVSTLVYFLKTKPINKISIAEIAKHSNIATGTFYVHFKSKEEALLYCYRFGDKIIEQIDLGGLSTIEQILLILNRHINMPVGNEDIQRHIYISQLKHYDAYFFSDDRPISRILKDLIIKGQNDGIITSTISSRDLVRKLLRFSRGLMFEYCIQHNSVASNWSDMAFTEVKEYLELFLNK
ncbi:MAG: TetR/AcrR family transcriptional regulator [Firmicutes bacterium]|nr:TetR/AcrR family transcriptional regulator [Bacillota bacterium]